METKYTVKNFRKFNHDGASVRFSPITILTGANSSGKSSIVKSLVIFEEYLRKVIGNFRNTGDFTPYRYSLDFTSSLFGLGRYSATFNKTADKNECMSFEYSVKSSLLCEEIYVEYSFVQDKCDKLDNGKLSDLIIYNSHREILLHIDFSPTDFPILKCESLFSWREAFLNFAIYSMTCLNRYQLQIVNKTSGDVQHTVDEINSQLSEIEQLPFTAKPEDKKYYTYWFTENGIPDLDILGAKSPFPYTYKNNYKSIGIIANSISENEYGKFDVDSVLNAAINKGIRSIFNRMQLSDYVTELKVDKAFGFDDNSVEPDPVIFSVHEDFSKFIKEVLKEVLIPDFIGGVTYVGSSRVALKRLYSLDDTSNDFGYLFRRYLESEKDYVPIISDTCDSYRPGTFMEFWLRKFGIAYDIDIRNNAEGQGIEVRLYSDKDDRRGHLLADEGYGITQLLALLLNIEVSILTAPILPAMHGEFIENLTKGNNFFCPLSYMPRTLTIEEPEVHLHPKYQAMLADLLLDAYKSYNIHFIVETHSEYLIRRSQVLVSRMNFATNEDADDKSPFRTIYVPDDGRPYNLFYRKDGKFAESFGPGFFDEASRLMFEIL